MGMVPIPNLQLPPPTPLHYHRGPLQCRGPGCRSGRGPPRGASAPSPPGTTGSLRSEPTHSRTDTLTPANWGMGGHRRGGGPKHAGGGLPGNPKQHALIQTRIRCAQTLMARGGGWLQSQPIASLDMAPGLRGSTPLRYFEGGPEDENLHIFKSKIGSQFLDKKLALFLI